MYHCLFHIYCRVGLIVQYLFWVNWLVKLMLTVWRVSFQISQGRIYIFPSELRVKNYAIVYGYEYQDRIWIFVVTEIISGQQCIKEDYKTSWAVVLWIAKNSWMLRMTLFTQWKDYQNLGSCRKFQKLYWAPSLCVLQSFLISLHLWLAWHNSLVNSHKMYLGSKFDIYLKTNHNWNAIILL